MIDWGEVIIAAVGFGMAIGIINASLWLLDSPWRIGYYKKVDHDR